MIPDRNLDPHKGKEAQTSGISLGEYERHFSPVVQRLRLCAPQCRGPGPTPGQGTRSHMLQLKAHMLQLKAHMPQLKVLHAATNTQ